MIFFEVVVMLSVITCLTFFSRNFKYVTEHRRHMVRHLITVLLVFSVTPLKINRSNEKYIKKKKIKTIAGDKWCNVKHQRTWKKSTNYHFTDKTTNLIIR